METSQRRGPRRQPVGGARTWLAALALVAAGVGGVAAAPEDVPSEGVARVVSLAPSVTETIMALGGRDRLVAVSSYCDFPPEVADLPRAGSYMQPNVERIVGLRPDVVLAVPTPGNRAAVEQVRRLGIEVVVVEEHTLEDAWAAMRTVGAWIGRAKEAEALVARVQGEIEAVRRRAATRPRRRVLFVVGHDPLIVAGEGLFVDQLIDVAGGDNVGALGSGMWPRLSLETVVAAAPDVIIDGAMGTESAPAAAASRRAWWQPYASVPAVREGRVRAPRSSALLRPGPRLGTAARELFELLHGAPSPAGAAS